MSNSELQSNIIRCMENLRPAIFQIIYCSDYNELDFDYYVDAIIDHHIILIHDGYEFASANTDQFKNPGSVMLWALEAITSFYVGDQEEENE